MYLCCVCTCAYLCVSLCISTCVAVCMYIYACMSMCAHTCRRTSFPSWCAGFLSVHIQARGWDWHAASGFGGSRFASLRVERWEEAWRAGGSSARLAPLPSRGKRAPPAAAASPGCRTSVVVLPATPEGPQPTRPHLRLLGPTCSGTLLLGSNDSVRCPPGASRGRHLPDTRLGAPHRSSRPAQPLSWPSGGRSGPGRSKAGAPAGGVFIAPC